MNDRPADPTPDRADELRGPLQALYAELDREIEVLAPRCELSGRCCRFDEYGHTLFLTEAEAVILIADAPPPSRPLDGGQTCPWQDVAGRCTARQARPLGCRVYFCDPAYEPHAGPITERYLLGLRQIAAELALPWNYAPLHQHLERASDEGRFIKMLDTNPSDQYS